MRNGAGTYSLPQAAFVPGTVISSTAVNSNFSDIGNALTQSIAANGETPITANLPMSGYRHTGVGNAVARSDYAAMGQIQDGAGIWCGTAGGTANALTLTPSPAITAYAAGQVFRFTAGASPNSGATTVAVSGLTAQAIQNAGAALTGGEIAAGRQYEILYDGTQFQLQAFASTSIADGSITNAKLANMAANTVKVRAANSSGVPSDLALSASQLLGRGATGDVAAIALGTGLSMSGATLNAALTSGLTFISSQTASASAVVDFTSGISATYDEYVISFEKVIPATDDVALFLRVSTDGGASFQTTSYLSSGIRWNTGGTGAEGRTDGISLSNNAGGPNSLQSNVTADGGLSGTVRFWPNGSAGRKAFIGESGGISASNGYFGFTVRGTWDGGNAAINAIRFLFSSGNITSGTFRLYGVQRS